MSRVHIFLWSRTCAEVVDEAFEKICFFHSGTKIKLTAKQESPTNCSVGSPSQLYYSK